MELVDETMKGVVVIVVGFRRRGGSYGFCKGRRKVMVDGDW